MAESSEVSIPTADGAMPAHLWFPDSVDGRDRPAILVFQEIFGVSSYVRSRCDDLAELGYAVLAPEFYWRLPQRTVDEGAEDVLEQGLALAGQLDWETAVRDGVSAAAHVASLPHVSSVGFVGFCFGGGLAYAVAAQASNPPEALVSYYGSALPQLVDAEVEVEVASLHHFGTADAYIPRDAVEDIRTWVTRGDNLVRFELYDGAGHAFDNPHPMFSHPQASLAAWDVTVDFLGEQLPVA
ncbi:dienelactone hydrolase family protein [Ornithinimicrobium sp. F0845]|uniref:dienelactone hydrolase family protein n=1 Tax=Ornithinimicrobium sp. F0845 TaxID=2926412 RepID=UPI001FF5C2DD|nr:dienelactone hydrolase family protein [Ornithinimicrobium sp. F0845]MCK0112113.1 dienelactone hydrolase family protein [Ornithinimicrobium sp. F0845]